MIKFIVKFKSVYFLIVSNQETKASDYEERAEEEDLDGHELLPSPDSGKSTDNEAALSPIKIRSDVNGLDHEECDELIHVENTTQACIMHALSIVSSFILFPIPQYKFIENLVTFIANIIHEIQYN